MLRDWTARSTLSTLFHSNKQGFGAALLFCGEVFCKYLVEKIELLLWADFVAKGA